MALIIAIRTVDRNYFGLFIKSLANLADGLLIPLGCSVCEDSTLTSMTTQYSTSIDLQIISFVLPNAFSFWHRENVRPVT